MDFLADMAASSAARAEGLDVDALRRVDATPRRLRTDAFTLIAEVKFASPSEGTLAPRGPVLDRASTYAAAGANAISVLTEPSRFHGSLDDLAAASSDALTMRKDFLVDPAQVWEARAHGASGVLLIATMLDDTTLEVMLQAAADAELFVLLEAFDTTDLSRCDVDWSGEQPLLVGVNCRNLRTLEVEFDRFEALAPHLPSGRITLAESGLSTPEHASKVAAWGYRGALVGSALMRADDPGARVRALKAAGGSTA